jgi:hypothetical protein
MNLLRVVLVGSVLLVTQNAFGATPKRYQCPQFVPEASVHLTPPGSDWMPFVSLPLYLNGAAPADGPPERLGIFRGGEVVKTKTGWSQNFSLIGRYPEGKWLRCDYGSVGAISLSKRLPDEITECKVSWKKGEHVEENIVEIWCK